MLGSNIGIAKGIKRCTFCCYVICATTIALVEEMPWPQTGATQYRLVRTSKKGRLIKGLVICYVVWLRSIKIEGYGS